MRLREILPSCKLDWLLPVIVCTLAAEPRFKCPIVECSKSDHWFENVRSIRSHCRRSHNTGITIESRDVILARQNKRRLCFIAGRRRQKVIEAEKKAIRERMSEILSDIGKSFVIDMLYDLGVLVCYILNIAKISNCLFASSCFSFRELCYRG